MINDESNVDLAPWQQWRPLGELNGCRKACRPGVAVYDAPSHVSAWQSGSKASPGSSRPVPLEGPSDRGAAGNALPCSPAREWNPWQLCSSTQPLAAATCTPLARRTSPLQRCPSSTRVPLSLPRHSPVLLRAPGRACLNEPLHPRHLLLHAANHGTLDLAPGRRGQAVAVDGTGNNTRQGTRLAALAASERVLPQRSASHSPLPNSNQTADSLHGRSYWCTGVLTPGRGRPC